MYHIRGIWELTPILQPYSTSSNQRNVVYCVPIISTPEYNLRSKWECGLVSCLFQKKKGGESSMFISEREIWLKATAQAMVDLTILLRNTYHTCPNTSAWYWLFVLLFCFYFKNKTFKKILLMKEYLRERKKKKVICSILNWQGNRDLWAFGQLKTYYWLILTFNKCLLTYLKYIKTLKNVFIQSFSKTMDYYFWYENSWVVSKGCAFEKMEYRLK